MSAMLTALIPLTKGLHALVDAEEYPALSAYKWHVSNTTKPYAVRNAPRFGGKRRCILMHRQILGFPDSTDIDHVNADTLDNRRSNLRACTRGQNMANSFNRRNSASVFKGIYKRGSRWCARLCVDGRRSILGNFDVELDAALAYDVAATLYCGEFARCNVLEDAHGA